MKVSDCATFLTCCPGYISQYCRGKKIHNIYDIKYETEERLIDEDEHTLWKEFPEHTKYLKYL